MTLCIRVFQEEEALGVEFILVVKFKPLFPASPTPFGVRSTYGDTAKHIQEFMRRPTLPYNSMDTLLGRRTVEERERIVEKRASITSGVGINIDSNSQSGQMSKSLDASNGSWRQADGRNLPHDDRIYQVEIQRVPASGRSAFDRIPTPEIPPPPPTSEIPPVTSPSNKSFVLNIKPTDSGRSETQKNNQATRSKTNVDLNESGGSTSSRTSARKSKPWKEESEEEKKRRLGTIYTGKDYVSPIDFSDQRPWPMVSGSETEEAKNKKN
ncbi:unnamed protein product [Caenorhabditis auriculariae]|uniref:Uncharacterized protein n=1 Tax=Caenorhabditis auriculariae TaxID=2777116 RepID=A0A8S1H6V9_9PELO|nr:unnamed protein product [Caenorhabditis auriculariae]